MQEPKPRLGTRRRYLAVEPTQLERAISSAPSRWAVGVCGMHGGCTGPCVATHTPSPLRFWRIGGFNCWSAVAGWPEKTGNSPLAQSRRCRLIAVMTAAVQ